MAAKQTYRYGILAVDVTKQKDVAGTIRSFQCIVRGYDHNNTVPREKYTIEAETNAKAGRIALQLYREKYGKEIK